MALTWGDPSTETFRKKHVREVRAAGTEALVNGQIIAIAARLIEGLSLAHVDIPEKMTSYDVDGTNAQRLGLALHVQLPLPPAPEIQELAARWGFDGFLVEETGMVELRFSGTPDDATRLNDEAQAARIDRVDEADVSGPSPTKWPGLRDLAEGDHGHDVKFLRLVLNAGDPEAPVDESLFDAVRRFQVRRGAPVTGLIDVDLWRRILPAGRPLVTQADSGFIVRVLQAALATYEDSTTKVTGTWGILTNRDITALQKEYNLRVGSFVRAPEWALLLGPEIPRIDEARARARGVGVPDAVVVPVSQPSKPGGTIGGVATTSRWAGQHRLGGIPVDVPAKPEPVEHVTTTAKTSTTTNAKRSTARRAPTKTKPS